MLKQSCVSAYFWSSSNYKWCDLSFFIYSMIPEDTISYLLQNGLVWVGPIEVFKEVMHMEIVFFSQYPVLSMPHMECMIGTEEIRIIVLHYRVHWDRQGHYYVAYSCRENQLQDINLFSLKQHSGDWSPGLGHKGQQAFHYAALSLPRGQWNFRLSPLPFPTWNTLNSQGLVIQPCVMPAFL